MPEAVIKVPPQPDNDKENKPTFNIKNSGELEVMCEIHNTEFFHMP